MADGEWELEADGTVLVSEGLYTNGVLAEVGTILGNNQVWLNTNNLPAHTHSISNHTHSFSATTSTKSLTGEVMNFAVQSSSTGAYGTGIVSRDKTTGAIAYATEQKNGTNTEYTDILNINASHNHTVSGTTGSSGRGNTGSTGNANPFSIVQPSKVVYRWHRVA